MAALVTSPAWSLFSLTQLIDPALFLAIAIVLLTVLRSLAARLPFTMKPWVNRLFGPLLASSAEILRRRKHPTDEALRPQEAEDSSSPGSEELNDASPSNAESAASPVDDADPPQDEPSPGTERQLLQNDLPTVGTDDSTPTSPSEPKAPEPPLPPEAAIPLPLPPTDPVLNDRLAVLHPRRFSRAPSSFPLFGSLPAELRLKIWYAVLEHRRFIRIYTTYSSGIGQRYSVHRGVRDGLESRRFPSALLAVSSEARCAALAFYRVALPAVEDAKPAPAVNGEAALLHPPGTPQPSDGAWSPVLYLNPEWDYVRLFSKRPTGVLEFLHDMRRHDPRGVGALNLVIGRGTLKDLTNAECAALKVWESSIKNEIGPILGRLESVFFSHRDRDKSRLWVRPPITRSPLQPIFARPTEFHLMGPDPRPGVQRTLAELWTCDGPRAVARDWQRLTGFFGVGLEAATAVGANGDAAVGAATITTTTQQRHMVCLRPEWKRAGNGSHSEWVHDREDLEDLLRVDAERGERMGLLEEPEEDPDPDHRERDLWGVPYSAGGGNAAAAGGGGDASAPPRCEEAPAVGLEEAGSSSSSSRMPDGDGAGEEEEEERGVDAAARVQPNDRVAGFWLLPTDAFVKCLEHRAGMYKWDVSAYTPELGVFRLPEKAAVRW